MKQNRPSLRDVVRPPEITAFIDRGETPGAPPAEGSEVTLSLSVPNELYEALRITVENRGISMEEATREMLMDYLMKGPE